MERTELKRARQKQVLITNALLATGLIIYFLVTNMLSITSAQLFLFLGVVLLIQSIWGLLKGDSTKSLIPVFEQVAIYEKQKMGREWKRQRRMACISNLLLSGFMFLQFYTSLDFRNPVLHADITFMLVMALLLFGVTNISILLQIRKVDRSTSTSSLKGYTWKTTLKGAVSGIVLAIVFIVLTIFYITLTI